VVKANLGKFSPGKYAVTAFYDKNSNGKLDTNMLKIPKEMIGVSNNVKPKFGPPKWGDVSFDLGDSDKTIEFSLGKPE
nr:DUF2141 domain-containing protein [Cellvibrionaceae bacterium]